MSFVLIIEDDNTQLKFYADQWEATTKSTDVHILTATSKEGAERHYDRYRKQIIGMIVDGAVPGGYLNMIPFIQRVRADGYQGVMVAASTRADYRKTMVEYGCTDEAEKRHAIERLVELLNQ